MAATKVTDRQLAAGIYIPVIGSSENPADGAAVFFGLGPRPITTAAITRIYFPRNCTIKMAQIAWSIQGINMSSHAMSLNIRLNNTTDTLIASVTDTNLWKVFKNTALNIAVKGILDASPDYVEFKITYPTFTTNPTAAHWTGFIWAV